MTESELERIYGELCRELSDMGEADGLLFLARFALLAIEKIDDAAVTRALLSAARAAGTADPRVSLEEPPTAKS